MRILVSARFIALVVATLFLSSTIVLASRTYFVSKSGSDGSSGYSWTAAKLTVRAAIDAADAGDQVWVAKGSYKEVVPFGQNFAPKAGVSMYGGFAGTETTLSQRHPFSRKSPDPCETVFDGDMHLNSVMTIPAGVTSSTRIDGFTIRGGNGTSLGSQEVGGGIYCLTGSPTIVNNTITGNTAAKGAGVYVAGGSPLILNNCIIANTCREGVDYGMSSYVYGGGIFVAAGTPTISGNYIQGNTATASTWNMFGPKPPASAIGGGLYLAGSAVVSSNVITGNSASASGGTITARGGGIWSADATITNNTICDNSTSVSSVHLPSPGDGGGIYCGAGYVGNNIIAFNIGGGVTSGGLAVFKNNDVYGNTVYQYSGASPGPGSFSLDPLFRDRSAGDYHLMARSPCVNGGYNDAPGMSSTDIDREGRVAGGTVDIGADELWWRVADARTSCDGMVVERPAAIVTAVLGSIFYIESDDRSSGIRVECTGHSLQPGMRADVIGSLQTNNDGEKYISATTAVQSTSPNSNGTVAPVALPLKFLGGSSFSYASGPPKIGQCGVKDCAGLNNIGLLVTVTGKVVDRDGANPSTWFRISDGSGVNVKVILPTGALSPALNSYVSVTGISSCEKLGDDVLPLIRAVSGGVTVLRGS
jgi:hypothetical protein